MIYDKGAGEPVLPCTYVCMLIKHADKEAGGARRRRTAAE